MKKFTRVRATSPEFTRVRSSLFFLFFVLSDFRVFVIGLPLLLFVEVKVTRRITKTRKLETTKKCIPLCECLPPHHKITGPKISCDDLHVINFCSKFFIFHSTEITTPEIWCQSSIKFDRLRPFPTIHGVFSIFVPFFGVSQFDRVRRSSIKFESH